MPKYYNTNKEKDKTLKQSNLKCSTQEETILYLFSVNKKLTASEAWRLFDKTNSTPLTSIRRAITNLCHDNHLKKTNETSLGMYGKQEHIYVFIKEIQAAKQLTIF